LGWIGSHKMDPWTTNSARMTSRDVAALNLTQQQQQPTTDAGGNTIGNATAR